MKTMEYSLLPTVWVATPEGEIASRVCVEQVAAQIINEDQIFTPGNDKKHPDPNIVNALSNSVNYASSRIYEHSLEDPSLRGGNHRNCC